MDTIDDQNLQEIPKIQQPDEFLCKLIIFGIAVIAVVSGVGAIIYLIS